MKRPTDLHGNNIVLYLMFVVPFVSYALFQYLPW